MEVLKPSDLKKKFDKSWIAPYEKVLTLVDGDNVEIIEYHPCISGSEWLVYQYENNSELIKSAYRDGNKHVYKAKIGSAPLDLKASFSAAGIDEIKVTDNEVKVTHSGLAGAGVGAGMCRGLAKGVNYIELHDIGGGSKLGRATVSSPKLQKIVIGIDDTDTKEEGATWTTAHNVAEELKNKGFEYIDHIIVQLYPHNPNKTQNCVGIAVTFAVPEDKKEELINNMVDLLKRDTLSEKTAIAILEGLAIPEKLKKYSMQAKTSMVEVETAEKLADELNIKLIEVTGREGKIGALAALGLYDNPKEAVKIYK